MKKGARNNEIEINEILTKIGWLADAPLFIDGDLINRFYDAVVMPQAKMEGGITFEVDDQKIKKIEKQFGVKAGAELDAGKLLSSLSAMLGSYFPSIGIKGDTSAGLKSHEDTTSRNKKIFTLIPIETPQRQLIQLTFHYLFNQTDRLFLIDNPAEENWRNPEVIKQVPRQLVFLDLPSQNRQLTEQSTNFVQFIPTAAEFADGKVIPLYFSLNKKNGERPPPYPEYGSTYGDRRIESVDLLLQARKDYWKWFKENYSAKLAMEVVEEAAYHHGRIRWIDYRLPIAEDGSTLHLHICPTEQYDTGTFAYNLIKRGSKHGIRIVGITKSEPDIDVLAIYNK